MSSSQKMVEACTSLICGREVCENPKSGIVAQPLCEWCDDLWNSGFAAPASDANRLSVKWTTIPLSISPELAALSRLRQIHGEGFRKEEWLVAPSVADILAADGDLWDYCTRVGCKRAQPKEPNVHALCRYCLEIWARVEEYQTLALKKRIRDNLKAAHRVTESSVNTQLYALRHAIDSFPPMMGRPLTIEDYKLGRKELALRLERKLDAEEAEQEAALAGHYPPEGSNTR